MFCLAHSLLSIFSYGSSLSASWIRDSSFTLYALIRLGFTEEANGEYNPSQSFFNLSSTSYDQAYLEFIFERIRDKNLDGSLQIMYTIHGPYLPPPSSFPLI